MVVEVVVIIFKFELLFFVVLVKYRIGSWKCKEGFGLGFGIFKRGG